jgi:hypothetical protein
MPPETELPPALPRVARSIAVASRDLFARALAADAALHKTTADLALHKTVADAALHKTVADAALHA